MRDRVVQMAAKLVLEPVFEADFLPCSYGFRPRRSATQALEALRKLGAEGGQYVLDADIRDYFGSIAHDKLMLLVARRVSDRRLLKLLRQWLQAGVLEAGAVRNTVAGTPQGGVISPLLANLYLHLLDEVWTRRCAQLGTLVRYCDDCVVMSRKARDCEEAQRRIEHILQRLGLQLHPDKTRLVTLVDGKEGFDLLGCHLHKRMSGVLWERSSSVVPPARSAQGATPASRRGRRLDARILREARSASPARDHPLPGAALLPQGGRVMLRADGPPVSRVREIRTHGLKGGVGSEPGVLPL